MIELYDPSLVFFWTDLASSRSYGNIGLATQGQVASARAQPPSLPLQVHKAKAAALTLSFSTSSTLTDIWRFPIRRLQISFWLVLRTAMIGIFYAISKACSSMRTGKNTSKWTTWFKCVWTSPRGKHVSSQRFIQQPVCETVEYIGQADMLESLYSTIILSWHTWTANIFWTMYSMAPHLLDGPFSRKKDRAYGARPLCSTRNRVNGNEADLLDKLLGFWAREPTRSAVHNTPPPPKLHVGAIVNSYCSISTSLLDT